MCRAAISTSSCSTLVPIWPQRLSTAPVKWLDVVQSLRDQCDLLIEVGPGQVLSGLVADINGSDGPICLPVAAKANASRDLNLVLARAFVQGVDVRWQELYLNRLVRPLVLPQQRLFIDNHCERPFQGFSQEATTPSSAKIVRCIASACRDRPGAAGPQSGRPADWVFPATALRLRPGCSMTSIWTQSRPLNWWPPVAKIRRCGRQSGPVADGLSANATLCLKSPRPFVWHSPIRLEEIPGRCEGVTTARVRDFAIEYA